MRALSRCCSAQGSQRERHSEVRIKTDLVREAKNHVIQPLLLFDTLASQAYGYPSLRSADDLPALMKFLRVSY